MCRIFAFFIKIPWQNLSKGVKYNSITKTNEVIITEKNVELSLLLQTYGKLLTKVQYDFLDDYYNSDLSLSEIAENRNITRQAARDNIKKGENKLFEFEEKLGLMQRTLKQERRISEILSEITTIQTQYSDEQIAEMLEHIKNELNMVV